MSAHLLDQLNLAGRVNAPEAALARLLLASRHLHEVSAIKNIIVNMILLPDPHWFVSPGSGRKLTKITYKPDLQPFKKAFCAYVVMFSDLLHT
jgi:hypothetical protein